jgi:hypothetical protein
VAINVSHGSEGFLCINYAVEHRVQMKKEEIHQHFDEALAKQAHL